MASELVKITRVIRRMRGGSQSLLVQGDDDHFYVAKFSGNPQGNRTLINEWIGHWFLNNLRVSVPHLRLLQVDDLITGSEHLCFKTGGHTFPISGGVHLGSRVPVDPTSTAIFDFLPRTLLPKVSNLADFARAYVVDKWLGQTDSRQAIFVRDGRGSRAVAFKAYFIDNGMLFAGREWHFVDSDLNGRYFDSTLYAGIEMETLCRETMEKLSQITISDLEALIGGIATSWFDAGDRTALERLMAQLLKRQNRLPELVVAGLAPQHRRTSQGFQSRPRV